MKRLICAALVLLPTWGYSQTQSLHATMSYAYDLDGEAADADQIITTANGDLLDSKTFTLTADPDACRLVDMTVTDANSSIIVGIVTVVGTGCLDEARTCTFDFSVVATRGSGVKTFTCTDGQGAYFKTVTSVTTNALTGEGGAGVDFMSLGYTANSVNGWTMYGTKVIGPNNEYEINPFGYLEIPKKITTAGVYTTTVDGLLAADDAFALVAVGDLLVITVNGVPYERKVTARASADQITVNKSINIPAAGVTFRVKKLWFSTNPSQLLAIPVHGQRSLLVNWSVDANANTGGTITLFECTDGRQPDWPNTPWVQISTTTVNSGSTQVPTAEAVDLLAKPYDYCRFGLRFGTGDDTDVAAEDINVSVTLLK